MRSCIAPVCMNFVSPSILAFHREASSNPDFTLTNNYLCESNCAIVYRLACGKDPEFHWCWVFRLARKRGASPVAISATTLWRACPPHKVTNLSGRPLPNPFYGRPYHPACRATPIPFTCPQGNPSVPIHATLVLFPPLSATRSPLWGLPRL